MKKYLLIALIILTSISCTKEEIIEPEIENCLCDRYLTFYWFNNPEEIMIPRFKHTPVYSESCEDTRTMKILNIDIPNTTILFPEITVVQSYVVIEYECEPLPERN